MSAHCKHFGQCGGCKFQDIPYQEQLKNKEAQIKKLFGYCSPIIPSPEVYFYRNRMDYAFGPDYAIGLKSGRNHIYDVKECLLADEKDVPILNRLRYFIAFKKLRGYPQGILRHVVVRHGKNIQTTILNVITSDKGEFPLEELWEKVRDLAQGVTWSINLFPADRSSGEIQKSIGQDYYLESLNGIKFKVPVQSFFQTNTKQAEKLLQVVKSFAGPQGKETILDLYSGTGSIGLYLADKTKEVIGVEENEAAVELSLANAQLNGINNYSALSGRVENLLPSINHKSTTIVLDPPRPGVPKKVLRKLGEMKPKKMVYVSCNPTTQKHNVDILREFGYKIEKCQPLDMFPHTPHIENIILLKS